MENKRLIDANSLENQFMFLRKMWCGTEIISVIDQEPTVDAVEVVHGHWTTLYTVDTWMGISKIDCFVCSECGKSSKAKGNYCPNCGAKMDGGNEDG